MIRYADFRNVKVRYADIGKGRVMVLLHGFLESLEVLEELALKLSKSFRVISIDLPGHGKTPVVGYMHSMDLMAQCVKSVLDSLHLKKYVLVGHSMGGYATLAFANLFPVPLAGFCLLHSTALPDSEEKKMDRDRMIEIVKKEHKNFVADLIPKLFAPENSSLFKKEIAVAKRVAMETSVEGTASALLGMKTRPSFEHTLKNSKVPVLFVIGKKDVLLAWENILLLTSLPKKSYHIILEHAGHMGFYEAPEETHKAIRKFCRMCFASAK